MNRSAKEIGSWLRVRSGEDKSGWRWSRFRSSCIPATKSGAQIQFHQVHEPTGKRIKYEKVVPGIGPVDRDEIVKGYEVSKGHYVLLDPEEIESVKLESRKTLDLVQFVDEDDIDATYFEKPYYVVPADDLAEEAYVVLRDALKAAKKVGVGQLAMRGQEYVVALKPCGRGLLLETLRYADEVHKSSGFFRDIGDHKPDPDLLDMASMLIERKAGEFDPKEFHNRYVDALHRADRGEAEEEGREDHRGPGRRRAAAEGIQCHRPHGRAEEEPRRREEGRQVEEEAAKKAPRRSVGEEGTGKGAGSQTGVSHGRAHRSTSRPTTASATSRRRRSPRAASSRARATASSSRSTMRRGCTGISGSSSTAF